MVCSAVPLGTPVVADPGKDPSLPLCCGTGVTPTPGWDTHAPSSATARNAASVAPPDRTWGYMQAFRVGTRTRRCRSRRAEPIPAPLVADPFLSACSAHRGAV